VPTPSLPALTIAPALPRTVDVLVVGRTDAGVRNVPEVVERAFAKKYGTSVAEMAAVVGAKSTEGHTRTLPAAGDGPRIVVVGLGGDEPGPEDLRRAAGVGVRQAGKLAENGHLSVAVSLGSTEPEQAQAVAEGALLGSYTYVPISSNPDESGRVSSVTVVHGARGKLGDVASDAQIVAQAVTIAREWVNIPANLLYPETFADQVRQLLRGTRVGIDVLDESALARDGYGGLLAVGSGSSQPPRLVRLAYRPRGATFHLVLVGKGITFDSGGLNLSPVRACTP
jgi:leucyl aminopeptidase